MFYPLFIFFEMKNQKYFSILNRKSKGRVAPMGELFSGLPGTAAAVGNVRGGGGGARERKKCGRMGV
jgi:hypothetical protein